MRVIILTCHRRGLASRCLRLLAESARCEVAAVVLSKATSASSGRARRRKIRKIMQIGMVGALNGIRMRAWYADGGAPDIESLCAQLGIHFVETPSVNGAATRRAFTDARADLGLSLGNSYISERVYRLPKYGMINFHGELLPKYQNAQSVIWPIYNGETDTGFTIHVVDKRIDAGDILYREKIPISFAPTLERTVRSTNNLVRERAAAAVVSVCENYSSLKDTAEPQRGGVTYTTPSIWQFVRMWRNNRKLHRAAQRR